MAEQSEQQQIHALATGNTIYDIHGQPFPEIRVVLGALPIRLPVVTLVQAMVDLSRQPVPDTAAAQMQKLERLAGPLVKGVMGVAVGYILSIAWTMYGRYAPELGAPAIPPGMDPMNYLKGYLGSLALRAAASQTWRLDYVEEPELADAEDAGIEITKISPADPA